MKKQVFTDVRSGESCVRIDHPSGLPIFVWNKPGYRSSYAVLSTRDGVPLSWRRCGYHGAGRHRALSGAQAV